MILWFRYYYQHNDTHEGSCNIEGAMVDMVAMVSMVEQEPMQMMQVMVNIQGKHSGHKLNKSY